MNILHGSSDEVEYPDWGQELTNGLPGLQAHIFLRGAYVMKNTGIVNIYGVTRRMEEAHLFSHLFKATNDLHDSAGKIPAMECSEARQWLGVHAASHDCSVLPPLV